MQFELISGSLLETDVSEEEYSFHMLSKIRNHMEKGSKIIISNLDFLYPSLYDLFNQNFDKNCSSGSKKFCRIALGSANSPMSLVHQEFKCIILMDADKVRK
mmetsp:Transcript_6216/g.5649  ORF Transcript_6216/g.5649 Transcript_6216/m.5649 type:complete len:102 (+) Transcript_6216:2813-3118(+)